MCLAHEPDWDILSSPFLWFSNNISFPLQERASELRSVWNILESCGENILERSLFPPATQLMSLEQGWVHGR